MTAFRPLGVDSNGVIESVGVDDGGNVVLKRQFTPEAYNPNAVLEDNKRQQIDNPKNQTADKSMRKVASIPLFVHELWKSMYGVDPLAKGNEMLLQRLLNDPEWREVRTDTGWVTLRGAQ